MARNDSAVLDQPPVETEVTTNGQHEDSDAEKNKAKREKVDIAKLAAEKPNEKVTLSFQIPAGPMLKLHQNAEEGKVANSEYVRGLVATAVGYEIPADFADRRGRPSGMSDEEKAAQNAKKRDNVNAILATVKSRADDPDVAALLAKLGITADDLPSVRGPRKKKEEATA